MAPVNLAAVLLGKTIPYLILAIFQGAVLLLLGKLLLGMSWGNSDSSFVSNAFWLGFMVVTSSIAAVGLGLLVASLARTMAQVSLWGLLPSLGLALLGGCILPRELFPEETRWISLLTPHGWALDGFRELLDGSTGSNPNWNQVLMAGIVLAIMGLVTGSISLLALLRKTDD
jgi:ABC-2 type transport system permease protein